MLQVLLIHFEDESGREKASNRTAPAPHTSSSGVNDIEFYLRCKRRGRTGCSALTADVTNTPASPSKGVMYNSTSAAQGEDKRAEAEI